MVNGIFVEVILVDGNLVENFGQKDYWSNTDNEYILEVCRKYKYCIS